MTALAFLAGVVVGVVGVFAVSLCIASSRMSRAEERYEHWRQRPMDDWRPEERR